MLKRFRSLLNERAKKAVRAYREVNSPPPRRLLLTEASILAMRDSMVPEIKRGHEGVAYLFGLTNGAATVVIGAIRPESRTTSGSFNVSAVAMARVVRAATEAGLQVVGQIHTHPVQAFHSGGDEDGARIAYDGYISIVVPDYGRLLPSLDGAAVYFYRGGAFSELGPRSIKVISGQF
jgi:proteasome lid subunit RPN8/RPN11